MMILFMDSSHMQKELWVVSGTDKREETKHFGFRVTLKRKDVDNLA